MKIKAISLWQPWASLVVPPGPKDFETRGWDTSYRGQLLICAAKGGLPHEEIINLLMQPMFFAALKHLIPKYGERDLPRLRLWAEAIYQNLPFGQAVATCNLVGTYKTEKIALSQIWFNLPFGDFSSGRFAWHLLDRRAIKPFPVTGRQRLFEVELPEDFEAMPGRTT